MDELIQKNIFAHSALFRFWESNFLAERDVTWWCSQTYFLFACYLTLFHSEWEVMINKIHVSGQTLGNRSLKAQILFSKESGKFGFSSQYFMFLLGTKSCPHSVLLLCQRMRSLLSAPPPRERFAYTFVKILPWEEPLACILLSPN